MFWFGVVGPDFFNGSVDSGADSDRHNKTILSRIALKEKRGLQRNGIYRRITSIMTMNRNHLAIVFGLILVLGAGYIIYAGRPVMNMPEQQAPVVTPPVVTPTTTPAVAATTTEPVATSTAAVTEEKPATTTTPTPATEPVKPKGVYSMADVQAHATVSDCWSAINGSVYDLTSWVSRHPGGENPIKGLCGTDGSAKFNRKHASGAKPQSMLALLKIGTLE